jgi:hypothetical protein
MAAPVYNPSYSDTEVGGCPRQKLEMLSKNKVNAKRAGSMTQMVENSGKALSLNRRTTNKIKI